MPRQNRVNPFGEIIATPERGLFMGNRGVLHDEVGTIRRPWQLRRWIICLAEFRGRKRVVMTPRRYTELFFLDEATGFAAGHRPCYECQRGRFEAFRDAWTIGNSVPTHPKAREIDDRLHAERVGAGRSKQAYRAKLDDLPDGVFVLVNGRERQACLVLGNSLLPWSPGGYGVARPRPEDETVSVLTPCSIVQAIRAGFVPGIHPSADI